jgi:DNA-binding transcriptional regulator YiaG
MGKGKDKPSARYHAAIVRFLGHDPNSDPKEFGQQIRAARQRDGLTPLQLAKRLGISASTVRAWEAGTVDRPSSRVENIFEAYVNED